MLCLVWKTRQGLQPYGPLNVRLNILGFILLALGSHLRFKQGNNILKENNYDQDELKGGRNDILIYLQFGEEREIISNSLDVHCISRSEISSIS